ncbi:Geranylgeranyl transferase type-1 subunit beta [Nowakowskiella sp. JEL0407]|nr:Geranylgeranyl transferase type-1 subunit beta [Nowakowskiella sp. JEL0407]
MSKRDIQYFSQCLQLLPDHYTSNDTNRMTLAYFIVSALDLLNSVDSVINRQNKEDWVNWIYAMQCDGGFRGGSYDGIKFDPFNKPTYQTLFDVPHVTMTYTAISLLLTLDDDLSRLEKSSIIENLKKLQNPDGSFVAFEGCLESDLRFAYCACVISHVLDDWSGVRKDDLVEYILKCRSHEGAFGQNPCNESHGGSTYLAVASLKLLGKLDDSFPRNSPQWNKLFKWLVFRQVGGFQGRPNKPADTCYSFWVGATLTMLGLDNFIDFKSNSEFLATTRAKYGGFSKTPPENPEDKNYPDVLHSYMGFASQAIHVDSGNEAALYFPMDLQKLDPVTNYSYRSLQRLQDIKSTWRNK